MLKENFVRHGKFHAANILPPGTDLVGIIRSSSAMTPMRVSIGAVRIGAIQEAKHR